LLFFVKFTFLKDILFYIKLIKYKYECLFYDILFNLIKYKQENESRNFNINSFEKFLMI